MPELICDTTVVQYLHQIGLLHLLPALASEVVIPTAVVEELAIGRAQGVALPEMQTLEWLHVAAPRSKPPIPDGEDLGEGEREVLWTAAERPNSIAVLDDGKARQIAARMKLRFTGTLGLLLDAKRSGLIPAVSPYIDKLRACNFRVSESACASILHEAGETL